MRSGGRRMRAGHCLDGVDPPGERTTGEDENQGSARMWSAKKDGGADWDWDDRFATYGRLPCADWTQTKLQQS